MQLRSLTASAVACAAALAVASPTPHAAAQQSPAPGWQVTQRSLPSAGYDELANGELIRFDGQFVERLAPDGTPLATLADLGQNLFSGILVVDPTETFAVVGESSFGDVYRVPLDGSGATLLANVPFNYDAAFSPAGELVVSAVVDGFGADNTLLELDPATGATTVVANVAGPSGPLAFDGQGNLYYATQTYTFPAPAGSTEVILWTAGQLAAGAPLTDQDAAVFSTGFDGAGSMVCDRTTGQLYLAEVGFGTGVARLVAVGSSAGSSPVLVEAPAFNSISIQDYTPPSGPELFVGYQPAAGAALFYSTTDFGAVNELYDLEPRRPELAFAGPAGGAPGLASLDGTGFPPAGGALLAFGPSSTVGPELPVMAGGLPLFVALDLGTLEFAQPLLAADAGGAFGLTFFDPGTLGGLLTVQAIALDAGGQPVGTSTAAGL